MQYPLISEYVRAMQDPAGNLDQLAHLVPVLDDHGEPMRSSGAFAVVFKMRDESTGKEYALKCFTEDQEGRAEAYRQIADELESVDSTYVTSVKYLEKELFVDCDGDEHEFPVLLMDWIEGETMDHYIAENLYDNYAMSMLCYRFCKMAAWLRSQPFAHGDIKPDNIMVRPDGTLTLIDYDGMFVPSMKGQTSPTIGTKDFSHPLRTKDDFDETIDDFALASIALSLKAISLSPSLFEEYGSSDRLLFSADDYRDLSQSKLLTALKPLMTDSELNTLLSLFLLAHATKTLSMVSFRLFSVSKPEYVPVDISTDVTDEDLAEAIEDEYGVKYSKDGKRLLNANNELSGEYRIREGTICICDSAFWTCNLTHIVIPDSVIIIGVTAFYGCSHLTSIVIPNGVTEIGWHAFSGCTSLTSIVLPNSVKEIGSYVFRGCTGLTSVVIPDGVTVIGEFAFWGCSHIANVVIPDSVTIIGKCAFKNCSDLTSVVIAKNMTKIGESAFMDCSGLRSIVIHSGVTEIGDYAFWGCSSLESIVIPDSISRIAKYAFYQCYSLTSIVIPNSVTEIGEGVFCYCIGLRDVLIPNSVMEIGMNAFWGCLSLESIVIPNSVTEIGEFVFLNCSHLASVVISNSMMEIGEYAFCGCINLVHIVIPDSVAIIGKGAFKECSRLASIKIPNSVSEIGEYSFYECSCLTNVDIPNSVIKVGVNAFSFCDIPEKIKIEIISNFGEAVFCDESI